MSTGTEERYSGNSEIRRGSNAGIAHGTAYSNVSSEISLPSMALKILPRLSK